MVRHAFARLSLLVLTLVFASSAAFAQYTETILVADSTNTATTSNPPDPLLINAWGLTRGPGTPFWVADAGSGWATLYTGSGAKIPLNVVVPAAVKGNQGSPTGTVFNGSGQFKVQGWTALFIFATLDGTISGWAPQVDLHNAILQVNKSKLRASYTALAITNRATGPNFLFAADTANNKVDIFDDHFKPMGFFTDRTVPRGMTVFGIRDIGGLLYVSFADSAGGPGGVIDIFTERGRFVKHLTSGAPLNQPWGFAAAPSNFGPLSNTLLVSNNVDNNGTINAFNALTGAFVGTVNDANGNPINIDQLWAIDFGGGTPVNGATNQLFFTAGPANNTQGIFGVIDLNP
jgi:uncharacterized protein (TIGR03118 family)